MPPISNAEEITSSPETRPRFWGERRYWLHPTRHGRDGDGGDEPLSPSGVERDDLPYKVEVWDIAKAAVEQVLAVTANGSIGYAAYYAAVREFPGRYVTLRHKNRILSSWNGPRN